MARKKVVLTRNALTTYVERYINGLRNSNHSANTLDAYGRVLHTMTTVLCKAFPVAGIADVKGYMLEEFVQEMYEVSDATLNYYMSIIKLFFSYIEEAGYLERNPAIVLKRARIIVSDEQEAKSLDKLAYTEKQLMGIIRQCEGNMAARDKAIIALLSGSGLRASELCSLTIADWKNKQNGHIYVKRKGGAFRWIAVADYVDAYIMRYLDERPWADDDEPLFITSHRQPVRRQALYKILAKRQKSAGVPKGVHIFRHTFLTGTSKTSNLKIAQSLANHSSESTTKRYIHTTADERTSAVNGTAWAEAMMENV